MTGRRDLEGLPPNGDAVYGELVEHAGDAIYVHDTTGRILHVNRKACENLGYTRDELLAMSIDQVDPEVGHSARSRMRRKTLSGEQQTIQSRHRRKDGSFFDVEVTASRMELPNGQVILGIVRDMTNRARRDEEYRQLIDAMNDTTFVIDFGARFLEVNERAAQLLGYTRDELLEMGPADIDPHLDPDAILHLVQTMASDEKQVFETEHRTKDGRIIPVEISSSLVSYLGDTAILSVARDITERKRAEEERERLREQLQRSAKLESIGRLAGGVAHDYNNMLGVIVGHADLALTQLDPADPLCQHLHEIRKAADHSASITRQLLGFARRQIVIPKALDLNVTVEGVLGMLRRLVGENIDLVWLPGSQLGRVMVDPYQIDQILVDLCGNARDALAGMATGTITIATSVVDVDEASCADREDCAAGEYLLLTVRDNGHGMDDTTLSHLFEPFFTTKEIGQGAGLGLATAYGIAKQNNGFVEVQSRAGEGTVVSIYLPVCS